MENTDRPAHPFHPKRPHSDEAANGYSGITKREYFAGLAMQGILTTLSDSSVNEKVRDIVARESVAMADELLKQLES